MIAVTILFVLKRPFAAVSAIFCAIVVFMGYSLMVFEDKAYRQRAAMKDFCLAALQIIGSDSKLFSYHDNSEVCIFYFGRVVPRCINDRRAMKEYYAGNWIFTSDRHIDELRNLGMRIIYSQTRPVDDKGKTLTRAIFHKTAPGREAFICHCDDCLGQSCAGCVKNNKN